MKSLASQLFAQQLAFEFVRAFEQERDVHVWVESKEHEFSYKFPLSKQGDKPSTMNYFIRLSLVQDILNKAGWISNNDSGPELDAFVLQLLKTDQSFKCMADHRPTTFPDCLPPG